MSGHILSDPVRLSTKQIGNFFKKVQVDPETGCWNWTGGKSSNGYGRFRFRDKTVFAHRLTYAWLVGELPPYPEQELHHTCDNKSCVNPEHLELLDHKVHLYKNPNSLVSIQSAQTRCPRCGGGYITRVDGKRCCPACKREYQRANLEKIRIRQRERRRTNNEQIKARERAYRRANKDHINACARERRRAKKRQA